MSESRNRPRPLLLPQVKRARGYRLYAEGEKRYIDFYQDEGYALFGHRPLDALQALKSSASKGLFGRYFSRWTGRSEKLLGQLFPFVFRTIFYPNMEAALLAVGSQTGKRASLVDTPLGLNSESDFAASVLREKSEQGELPVLHWRPFALGSEDMGRLAAGEFGPLFIPLIPFPGAFLPVPVCYIDPKTTAEAISPQISPALLGLLGKAIATTLQKLERGEQEGWKNFDIPGILRFGPYMRFRIGKDAYTELYYDMLGNGILLPPSSDSSAIIPGEFSSGEVFPLIEALRRIYADS